MVSNNCGVDGAGLGVLLDAGRITPRSSRATSARTRSSPGSTWPASSRCELTPQGTLAERLRAGGAGIPAFYTPTGVGTPVAEGGLPWRYGPDGDGRDRVSPPKEVRDFDGREYVLEASITADFALVRAAVGRPARQPRLPRVRAQLQPRSPRWPAG